MSTRHRSSRIQASKQPASPARHPRLNSGRRHSGSFAEPQHPSSLVPLTAYVVGRGDRRQTVGRLSVPVCALDSRSQISGGRGNKQRAGTSTARQRAFHSLPFASQGLSRRAAAVGEQQHITYTAAERLSQHSTALPASQPASHSRTRSLTHQHRKRYRRCTIGKQADRQADDALQPPLLIATLSPGRAPALHAQPSKAQRQLIEDPALVPAKPQTLPEASQQRPRTGSIVFTTIPFQQPSRSRPPARQNPPSPPPRRRLTRLAPSHCERLAVQSSSPAPDICQQQ